MSGEIVRETREPSRFRNLPTSPAIYSRRALYSFSQFLSSPTARSVSEDSCRVYVRARARAPPSGLCSGELYDRPISRPRFRARSREENRANRRSVRGTKGRESRRRVREEEPPEVQHARRFVELVGADRPRARQIANLCRYELSASANGDDGFLRARRNR